MRVEAHTKKRSRILPLKIAAACCVLFFVFATQPRAHAQQEISGRRITAPTRPGANTNAPAISQPKRPSSGGGSAPATGGKPSKPKAPETVVAPVTSVAATSGGGVKLDGIEYIDLVRLAKSLGLSPTWLKAAERLYLKKSGMQIEVNGDSKELSVNGVRVFAGSAIRSYKRSLWISRRDADALFTPLVEQGKGRKSVPLLKTIVIDPGHGGNDAGTVNARLKLYEKTFTLDTAVRLKKLLEQQGYKVVMTRTTDKFVELGDRPEIAAKVKADLFVSVHFNSAENVTGIETYRFTPRYQQPLRRDKARPEDAMENPGDANTYWSSIAAFKMQQALLGDLKASDRGFKHDKLAVLRLAPCPAILVEPGFLSSDAEARKIATPAYRQKIAEAISDGIKDYAVTLMAARMR